MSDKEEYSTFKAWGGKKLPNMKEQYWYNMAEHFRKVFKSLEIDLIHFAQENSDDKLADLLKEHEIFVYENEPEYERPQNIYPSTKKGG